MLKKLLQLQFAPFLAALIFAVHPIGVESVAWVSERKGLLSAGFALAATRWYINYCEGGGRGNLVLCWCAFLMASLAKPNVVALPLVPLLVGSSLFRRSARSEAISPSAWCQALPMVRSVAPMLFVPLFVVPITILAENETGSLTAFHSQSLVLGLANAIVVPWVQFLRTLLPTQLSPFYPTLPWTWVQLLGGVTFASMAFWLVWVSPRTPQTLRLGLIWYLVASLPVVGIIPVGEHVVADRYLYLPMMGVVVPIVAAIEREATDLVKRCLAFTGIVVLAIGLAALTVYQQRAWRSSEALCLHSLRLNQDDWKAHNNLGVEYMNVGRNDEARSHFKEASRLRGALLAPKYNLGLLLLRARKYGEALVWLKAAEQLAPNNATLLAFIGHAELRRGRVAEAIYYYSESLRREPDHVKSLTDLAIIYSTTPNEQNRQGALSLQLAARANELTMGVEFGALLAVACAHAEVRDFTNAIEFGHAALRSARAVGRTNTLATIHAILGSLEQNQAFRAAYIDMN